MEKLTKSDKGRIMNRKDGWVNTLAGLGRKGDKTKATWFGDFEYIQDTELTRMWMGEGLGKKIVSTVANDMTRGWITIDGDPENKLFKELSRLNAKFIFNRAVKWMRLYRGSVIVVGYNDGGRLEDPVNWNRVKGIDWIKEYPAPRIQNVQADLVTDPASPYFEDFERFKIFRMDGIIMQVHRSRCLPLRGEPVPHLLHGVNFYYLYWGQSALQSVFQQIKDLSGATQSLANLMFEVVIGKYKISNLAQILAANNTEAIYNRIEIINASKSIINGVLLGENEDYTRDSVNLAGTSDVLDRFMMLLSAVTDIPMTRLFGRAPAGLNATGESDMRMYYDMVSSEQEAKLLNPIQALIEGINKYIKVKGEPTAKFVSIWQPTQSEMVDMRNKQANTDATYIDKGVLDPEEVRQSRFKDGYNLETTLMDDADLALYNESKVPGTNTTEQEMESVEEGQTAEPKGKKKSTGKATGETPVVPEKKGKSKEE